VGEWAISSLSPILRALLTFLHQEIKGKYRKSRSLPLLFIPNGILVIKQSRASSVAMFVYSMSPVYYRDCYFDRPYVTRKTKWTIVYIETNDNTKAEGKGYCAKAVEWSPLGGIGSSLKSIFDEMCSICLERLKKNQV
jgi:hypothetical protein